MTKKALVLGGGLDQITLIREFKTRGFFVILIDYYDEPIAKVYADQHFKVSTYDKEAVLEVARHEKIDVIGTVSTDQPLVTAAYVSEQLGLNYPLTLQQLLDLTNKRRMKKVLFDAKIPTSTYTTAKSLADVDVELQKFRYPLILKPVDSSGSRGIGVATNSTALPRVFDDAKNASRTSEVVIEEFFEGTEISIDATVVEGHAEVVLITDNYTVKDSAKFGLFRKSVYPSTISDAARAKVSEYCDRIAKAFKLTSSPLFVQMLVKGDDVNVIELSARVAGGSKPYLIPVLTGFNMVGFYVDCLLGQKRQLKSENYPIHAAVGYIYGRPGRVVAFEGFEELKLSGEVAFYSFYKPTGTVCEGMRSGADRLAVFFVIKPTLAEVQHTLKTVDAKLRILDETGQDIMVHSLFL